ncbi:hypothetical protein L0222_32935, partial [bacterium]|nr:hypothetical protein [bacterium]
MEHFLQLLEWLTGTPVKGLNETDRKFLAQALINPDREIDCAQFNELLLLSNKDRVQEPFFELFFCINGGKKCRIADIEKGVKRFQTAPMLAFGNFIYAYRRLSRYTSKEDIRKDLIEYCRDETDDLERFAERSPKVLEIEAIKRDDTYMIGYLSAQEIVAEYSRASKIREVLEKESFDSWESFEAALSLAVSEKERNSVFHYHKRFLLQNPGATVNEFMQRINADINQLARLNSKVKQIQ